MFSGSSGKSRDERFLLQEANGTFLQSGYYKAIQAKKDRESKVCMMDMPDEILAIFLLAHSFMNRF